MRLKEHEISGEHFNYMSTWIDLRVRLEKNITINKNIEDQI